jgi:hypothetical protein
MSDLIIHEVATSERMARGLADYYARRRRGVRCPDPLGPAERACVNELRDRQLQSARRFVAHVRPDVVT